MRFSLCLHSYRVEHEHVQGQVEGLEFLCTAADVGEGGEVEFEECEGGPGMLRLMASARSLALSMSRTAMMTWAPRAARTRVDSRPRPAEAPVTKTTLPWPSQSAATWAAVALDPKPDGPGLWFLVL